MYAIRANASFGMNILAIQLNLLIFIHYFLMESYFGVFHLGERKYHCTKGHLRSSFRHLFKELGNFRKGNKYTTYLSKFGSSIQPTQIDTHTHSEAFRVSPSSHTHKHSQRRLPHTLYRHSECMRKTSIVVKYVFCLPQRYFGNVIYCSISTSKQKEKSIVNNGFINTDTKKLLEIYILVQ